MKIRRNTKDYYEIIRTGKISVPGIADRKPIPVLVINKLTSPKLNELCKIHKDAPPGDIEHIWGIPLSPFSPKYIILEFNFTKHMELSFNLKFDIKYQFSLIDEIFQSKAIYMNTGIRGNDLSQSIKGGILVEVPMTDIHQRWEKILFNTVKDIYKKEKLNKKELNRITREHITKMRQKWQAPY